MRGALPQPSAMERLPSGRHRLTREDVVSSQLGRMLLAVAEVVSEKGYGATTVSDVVDRASVSKKTFYEQFASKEDCFLAAFEAGAEYVLGRLASAAEELGEEAGWRQRLRSDLTAYMKVLSTEPAFAWALHVESLAAGARTLERRAQIFALFSRRTRRAYEQVRAEDPARPELPDEAFLFHSAGVDELVRECLRTRGAAALPELVEPTYRTTLALFGDRGG